MARLVALCLASVVVYSLTFATASMPWLVADLAIIAACGWYARRTRVDALWCALIALVSVLASQLVIPDKNGIWADESAYLSTLRESRVLLDGVRPFSLRWLEPFLAGPLNVTPLTDADALKALNFGALVVTGAYLGWFLLRLEVRRVLAYLAPIVLLSSYLGVYASTNRLVLDPFNYAVYVLIAHCLLRREDAKYLPWLLLVGAFNSEKVIYWIPVIAVATYFRGESLRSCAKVVVPTALYLALMLFLTRGAPTDNHGTFMEQLFRMQLSVQPTRIKDPLVVGTTMQMLWFPFGAFTVFALLGLVYAPRWLKSFALLLVPILIQTLVATDTQRMTAYAFIVFIPLGSIYLSRAMSAVGVLLVPLLVAVTACEHYWRHMHHRFLFAALEVTVTFVIVFLHLTRADSRDT